MGSQFRNRGLLVQLSYLGPGPNNGEAVEYGASAPWRHEPVPTALETGQPLGFHQVRAAAGGSGGHAWCARRR